MAELFTSLLLYCQLTSPSGIYSPRECAIKVKSCLNSMEFSNSENGTIFTIRLQKDIIKRCTEKL